MPKYEILAEHVDQLYIKYEETVQFVLIFPYNQNSSRTER